MTFAISNLTIDRSKFPPFASLKENESHVEKKRLWKSSIGFKSTVGWTLV